MSETGQPQTQAELYAAFADTDVAQAITPAVMRNFVASVTIVPGGIGWQLTSKGTDVATAFALAAQFNYFSVVPGGSGAALPTAGLALGTELTIGNFGANTLEIYAQPGDVLVLAGATFAVLGLNVANTMKVVAMSPGFWWVTNLYT